MSKSKSKHNSESININITNNQSNTSTLNNTNSLNNSFVPAPSPTPVVPRRTVFLSADDPSLAITVDVNTGNVFVSPFTNSPDQVFLTTFGLTSVSRIIPSSSPDSVLTSNEDILSTLAVNQVPPPNFLVIVSPISQVPPGRSIDWLLTTALDPTGQAFSRIGITPSNWQITLPDIPLSQENITMNPNLILRPSGSNFIAVFLA